MSGRIVKLVDPCQRCGGALADLASSWIGTPRCHYCGARADLAVIERLAGLASELGRRLSQRTRFRRIAVEEHASRSLADQLRSAMGDLTRLYAEGARDALETIPAELAGDEDEFLEANAFIGRGLLVKLLSGALRPEDCQPPLSDVVMQYLGAEPWRQDEHARHLGRLVALAPDIDWRMVLSPFRALPSFRRRTAELVTNASRILNLLIKFDGVVTEGELDRQATLQSELEAQIAGFPRLPPPSHQPHPERAVFDQLREDGAWLRRQLGALTPPNPFKRRGNPLKEALDDLDALVGVDLVKQDVRGLVDVLQLKAERRRLGLPEADVRLHLAFLGNDGTGQGTVAAILGRICAALGELDRGHLSETSGEALATEQADLDERFEVAQGGVLLVHHASRLRVAAERTDHAARTWQRLLACTREHDGGVLLILADAELPMQQMFESEQGLRGRFRQLTFQDHTTVELARVLETMVRKNRYRLSQGARLKIINGLHYLVQRQGRVPGNARAIARIFEQAVERQARRLARARDLDGSILAILDAEDFVLEGVPEDVSKRLPASLNTKCPRCGRTGRFPPKLLGGRIQCRSCRHELFADWGIPSAS